MSVNFPEPDWHSISDMEITNFLESHGQPTGYVAGAAAKTAKRIFQWCKDNYPHPNHWRTPANTMGFHSVFFWHIQERHAVKNHLEQMIHNAATALDRTCGVSTIIIHLHGECHPKTGLLPITPELAPHNAIIRATDIIFCNTTFEPVMAELKHFILAFILTLFLRDWHQCAFSLRYITADALFLLS
ncbi:hypothetical protein EWM64_g6126 [Hericium alpestre]|uniref:Uncharacterized protein n=1 Tax=Hericium alpestre TaxID=135208 RepID=A0A4Y9ZSM3_9AGAM|nr:hypothetical protein EWM64_g6126 [Hericium alpestre]